LQHHYQTLTKPGKVATLNKLTPGPFVEVHPQDAHALGIKEKDTVEIRSRRGYVMLPAVITERVLPGNCFAPFHWSDVFGENLALNALTNDAVDPISQQPEMKFCAVALKRVELSARDSHHQPAANAEPQELAFAPLTEQASDKLIQTFTRETGMNQNATHVKRPDFSAAEQQYLSGYIN